MIHLLNDIPHNEQSGKEASPLGYHSWLAAQCGMSRDAIHPHDSDENLRNQYDRAFTFTQETIKSIYRDQPQAEYALLLTPGYPAVQVAMLIAAHTLFDREPTLYNTFEPCRDRPGAEVEVVHLPFTLSIDAVVRKILHPPPSDLAAASEAFGAISGASQAIDGARQLASRVARFTDVPVLLWGETGDRQGAFRPRDPRRQPVQGRPVCRSQLRRACGNALGKRTVRPRERLVYRCNSTAHRQIQAGPRGNLQFRLGTEW